MASTQAPRKPRAKTGDGTWQAEKSRLTREQILEATLQCLVEIGYAQTTTEKIAKQAGVSRGAMTHHFKSRAEVLSAAAKFLIERRVQEYDEAITSYIHLGDGELPTMHGMVETITAVQKYYALPSFIALQELLLGARTDKTLKRIMAPLEKTLDQKINASLLHRFPVWEEIQGTSEMLRDLILSTMQAVAMDPVGYVKGKRLQRVMDLLARVAMDEFEKAYVANHGVGALKRARSQAQKVA